MLRILSRYLMIRHHRPGYGWGLAISARHTAVAKSGFHDEAPTVEEMASNMVDQSDFEDITKGMAEVDEKREQVIKLSRDIQKLSKKAIFSLHRAEYEEATARLSSAESIAQKLLPIVEANPALRFGSFAGAMEEMAEGRILQVFLQERRLATSKELPMVTREEYLGGVLDFTGELNRYAIAQATKRDVAATQTCRDLVEAILLQCIQMDFRNGALRKKYDSLKYTLKKMENTLYELSLIQATGRPVGDAQDEEGPQDVAPDGDAGL